MKISADKNLSVYRVWIKNGEVQIKEYFLLKKEGESYTLKDPKRDEVLMLPINDNEFYFNKNEAINVAMRKTVNLQSVNPIMSRHTLSPTILTGKFKDIIKQKRLFINSTIYKVYNTKGGAKVEKYTIKKFLNNAILVADEQGKENKFYQADIENLLNSEEKDIEVARLKEIGPITKQSREICWSCKNFFNKIKQPKCPICGASVCPTCGKCLCGYSRHIKYNY